MLPGLSGPHPTGVASGGTVYSTLVPPCSGDPTHTTSGGGGSGRSVERSNPGGVDGVGCGDGGGAGGDVGGRDSVVSGGEGVPERGGHVVAGARGDRVEEMPSCPILLPSLPLVSQQLPPMAKFTGECCNQVRCVPTTQDR